MLVSRYKLLVVALFMCIIPTQSAYSSALLPTNSIGANPQEATTASLFALGLLSTGLAISLNIIIPKAIYAVKCACNSDYTQRQLLFAVFKKNTKLAQQLIKWGGANPNH